jgi:hypothetical protein
VFAREAVESAIHDVRTAIAGAALVAVAPDLVGALLSHLGGPQPQRHLGIGWILFSTAKEIGQGFALKQAQLRQA